MKKNTDQSIYIYGRHSLEEALSAAPQIIQKVSLDNRREYGDILAKLKRLEINVQPLNTDRMPVGDRQSHQGVVAKISLKSLIKPWRDFFEDVSVTPSTAFLLLDELQDPQNVGAVIRSAAAFGFSGVLLPQHNQAPVTGAVIKVSAGMAFKIPLVSIGNVNQTLERLKKEGFWVYGLDQNGDHNISEETFDRPTVIVLGNEGRGIRSKTLELCDVRLGIGINPRSESLNAAAAAAVAGYAWSLRHPQALSS